MNDTPRVTVPVEILRELIDSSSEVRDLLAKTPGVQGREYNGTGIRFVNAIGAAQRAYVSAAPAPEGGAVDIDDMRVRARYLRDYAPLVSAAMYGGEKPSGIWNLNRAADLLDLAATALATREEAQVEAEEPSLVDWFSQFIERHQEGCGSDTDALIACLDRVRDSYRQPAHRAQPPAREDAQPVAQVVSCFASGMGEMKSVEWCGDVPPPGTSLYTHPAPDALQAEQKGGA